MLRDVALLEPNAIASPLVVVVHHIEAGSFYGGFRRLGLLEARLNPDGILLWPEDDESVGLPILCEADVELVVLELKVRVESAHDLQ